MTRWLRLILLLLVSGCATPSRLATTGRIVPGGGNCECVEYPKDYPASERYTETFYLDCYMDLNRDGFLTRDERWRQQHVPKGFKCQ